MTVMRAYPLIFLAALSCSPATPDTTTNAAATEVAGTTRDPAPATHPPAGGAQDDHVRPKPGELKTFGDWTIGCDNGLACQANALVPDISGRDGYLLLLIDRGGDQPGRGPADRAAWRSAARRPDAAHRRQALRAADARS